MMEFASSRRLTGTELRPDGRRESDRHTSVRVRSKGRLLLNRISLLWREMPFRTELLLPSTTRNPWKLTKSGISDRKRTSLSSFPLSCTDLHHSWVIDPQRRRAYSAFTCRSQLPAKALVWKSDPALSSPFPPNPHEPTALTPNWYNKYKMWWWALDTHNIQA